MSGFKNKPDSVAFYLEDMIKKRFFSDILYMKVYGIYVEQLQDYKKAEQTLDRVRSYLFSTTFTGTLLALNPSIFIFLAAFFAKFSSLDFTSALGIFALIEAFAVSITLVVICIDFL